MIPVQQGKSFKISQKCWSAVFICPLCGNNFIARVSDARSGRTSTCGCACHGQNRKPVYYVWQAMKKRCMNEEYKDYDAYGGRGIAVCDRWMDFKNFYEDMGSKPEGMSLDRIDNNGNYCPENCRWATTSQQARNKRSSRYLTHNGRTLCLADWSAETGIGQSVLTHRLKLGWEIERVLSISDLQRKRKLL